MIVWLPGTPAPRRVTAGWRQVVYDTIVQGACQRRFDGKVRVTFQPTSKDNRGIIMPAQLFPVVTLTLEGLVAARVIGDVVRDVAELTIYEPLRGAGYQDGMTVTVEDW